MDQRTPEASREQTLDPADWEAFRALGHRMVDDMVEHLATLRERPPWRTVPEATRRALDEPLPHAAQGETNVYEQFLEHVLPYSNGNRHPRHWGWVHGNGTPLAMLADMLASGMNPHLAGYDQAPAIVERQVVAWLTELMGMPSTSSGLLVEGGTMANIVGLSVARHAKAGFDVRAEGLHGGEHPRLVVYHSSETHGWLRKGMHLLGLGERSLHAVPCDAHGRMQLAALSEAIALDRREGLRPICVVATAGTVNTGAIDDLASIAELCREQDLWFHVDGAFGALAKLSSKARELVAGLELADSLAFDLHKWMYLPFGVACVLVRDARAHRETFAMNAAYIAPQARGVIAGGLPFADHGVDLTRSFRALKVWMSLKAHGVDAFARLVDQNVEQAQHLARAVRAHAELELLAPVALNVVCFRCAPAGVAENVLDALNRELLLRLQERGIAIPSSTSIGGKYALRCAITNHRSRLDDFDALVDATVALGRELAAESQAFGGMSAARPSS